MSGGGELRDRIRALCRDPEYALALFLRAFMYPRGYIHFWDYAKLYGLSGEKLEEIDRAVGSLKSEVDYQTLRSLLEEVSCECVERFSSELERASRERIGRLQDLEARALRYASYFIKVFGERYGNTNALYVSFFESDKLAESLCAALFLGCIHAMEIARGVLAKTGIAFYTFELLKPPASGTYYFYYYYFVPPYALRIVEELAKEVEEEVRRIGKALRRLDDAKALSALLIELAGGDPDVFWKVYGELLPNYMERFRIPGVYYRGGLCPNYALRDLVVNTAIDLAGRRFEKLYTVLRSALSEKGFHTSVVREPTPEDISYTILAAKPGHYDVTIHVIPFPYKGVERTAEREVLVFEGPVARPEEFQGFVVVGMDKGFEGVKAVFDNVGAEWSREVSEVFRSLRIMIPVRRRILEKVRRFPARDILESVVAAVLSDLSFEVRTNYQARAKDGTTREVDVWAWKIVAGVPFRVYVSCKNLDGEVGGPVVDQEVGRVDQLLEAPHMKFIVASRFNENGRRAAVADGFIPIEVGFKVDEGNVAEAYRRVYRAMSEAFTAIAPRRLQQLAEAAIKISEQLRNVYEELSRLAGSSPT